MGESVTHNQIINFMSTNYPSTRQFSEEYKWNELLIRAKNREFTIKEANSIMKKLFNSDVFYDENKKYYKFIYLEATYLLKEDEYFEFVVNHI